MCRIDVDVCVRGMGHVCLTCVDVCVRGMGHVCLTCVDVCLTRVDAMCLTCVVLMWLVHVYDSISRSSHHAPVAARTTASHDGIQRCAASHHVHVRVAHASSHPLAHQHHMHMSHCHHISRPSHAVWH